MEPSPLSRRFFWGIMNRLRQPAGLPAYRFKIQPYYHTVNLGIGLPHTVATQYTPRLSSNLRPLLKSEKGSAGVSKSPTSLKSNQQQQKSSASCGGLVVFPRQRPPSRTPQLRRGAPAAAGCERSSAGPCGGRSTLPAHPRPVVSGASSRR